PDPRAAAPRRARQALAQPRLRLLGDTALGGQAEAPRTRRRYQAGAQGARLALVLGGRALADLLHREVFLVRRHVPDVAVRIDDAPRAVTVELVLHRPERLRAGCDGATDDGVHVLDVQVQHHRRATDRARAAKVHFRVLVGQHDLRVADLQLRVPDAPVG